MMAFHRFTSSINTLYCGFLILWHPPLSYRYNEHAVSLSCFSRLVYLNPAHVIYLAIILVN